MAESVSGAAAGLNGNQPSQIGGIRVLRLKRKQMNNYSWEAVSVQTADYQTDRNRLS